MARQRFTRTQRVASLLRQVLSEVLLGAVKDPRAAHATLTEVEVTPDLREARVYVHLTGDERERAAALAALNRASGFFRREIGQRIQLRTTPSIEFRYDASIEYGARIEGQLRALGLGGATVSDRQEEAGEEAPEEAAEEASEPAEAPTTGAQRGGEPEDPRDGA